MQEFEFQPTRDDSQVIWTMLKEWPTNDVLAFRARETVYEIEDEIEQEMEETDPNIDDTIHRAICVLASTEDPLLHVWVNEEYACYIDPDHPWGDEDGVSC